MKGTRRITTLEEKKNNLKETLSEILNAEILIRYNAVGLIGGEFFSGQLEGCETEWFELIKNINSLLYYEHIKEFWLATALLYKDTKLLEETLDYLYIDQYEHGQCVRVCTSYDTVGRFITPEREQIWLDNIKLIKEKYPKIQLHTQTILTQDTIEKLLENPDYFDFITKYSSIDFRYPSISRADCPTATIIRDYRSLLLKRYQEFPSKFFIEDRSKFLKFLKVFSEKYGLEKVKNLIHQPEMRSRRLRIYIDEAEIKDRWNDDRNVYLPCGHLVDGLCYINSEKCIYCDIEKFIKGVEG